jgi:glutaminyl-peptide cyclotransferase
MKPKYKTTYHKTKHQQLTTATLCLTLFLIGQLVTGCGSRPIQEQESDPTSTKILVTKTPEPTVTPFPRVFDGQRAFQDVETQLAFGPRTAGSQAHLISGEWISSELKQAGWQVEIQETIFQGHPVRNIIGKWGQGDPWIILGAHYDSRLVADQDPDAQKQSQAVPGANDGASGVAVLLELARVLPAQLEGNPIQDSAGDGQKNRRAEQIWIVFFDVEDNGKLPGWDWILGSRAFVASLTEKPDAAIIIDMIGDRNLNLNFEKSSNMGLNLEIWAAAASEGYSDKFIPQPGSSILDDHRPFLEAGITAVDLIDFDYPYWHTTADTLDKVSADSLKAIGDTLLAWLKIGSTMFSQP